jgi:hypothetical protein
MNEKGSMTSHAVTAALDRACDGTSYGDRSALEASSAMRAANMFLCSFYEDGRRADVYLVEEARERLAKAHVAATTLLRLIEEADTALKGIVK